MYFQRLTAAIFVTAITLPAHSAIIEWSSAFNTSSAADVITVGNTVEAFNLTGSNGDTEVNGVEFEHQDELLGRDFGRALDGNSSGNTDYNNTLLNSFAYGGGKSTSIDIGDDGLFDSNLYLVQAWYTDLRPRQRGRVMTLGDGNGNSVALDGFGSGLGQFAVGVFFADSVSQVLELSTNGFKNAHLNGYQLRGIYGDSGFAGTDLKGVLSTVLAGAGLATNDNTTVPVPATPALFGLGLLLLRTRKQVAASQNAPDGPLSPA